MATDPRTLWRKIRHKVMTSGHSYGSGSAVTQWIYAQQLATLIDLWERLENADLVRLRTPFDEAGFSWEDLEGDMFDVELNADSVPGGERTIKAQQKAFRERAERDGVGGIVGEYRTKPDGKWEHGGSCWGIVFGDYRDLNDPFENEIAGDVMSETIDALRDALRDRCPCCRRPRPR